MEWFMTTVLGTIIICILYWRAISQANYWKKRGIPYLKSLPIIGNMSNVILLRKAFPENVHDMYMKLDGYKYGGYMQFTKPVLIIRDPELIHQIMNKDFLSFHGRGLPMSEEIEPLTASLLNLSGDRWRKVRHKLIPTFTDCKLRKMFTQLDECSIDAIRFLKDKKEALEVKQYMQKFNLNVIGLVAFGLKVDALNIDNNNDNEFLKQSIKFFAPSMKILLNFLITMSCPKFGKLLKLRIMDPGVTDFFVNLVKDMITYREETNTKRNDFIQSMLELKHNEISKLENTLNEREYQFCNIETMNAEDSLKQIDNASHQNEHQTPVFTDMCITAQSFFFISGGSETTATVLSFALYELAANLTVQDRVRQEVDTVLMTQDFNYQAIKEMTYLEQVIYEVMRLHPPAGTLTRVCTEDFILPDTDKVVEKGVLINIPVLALHKNPEYFSDPYIFDPDRFKDMKSVPKGVFLPFGDGPRICIAKRLAMLEMKIYLARLVSKYNVALSDKTKLPLKMAINSITLNVEGGIWVLFRERQQ